MIRILLSTIIFLSFSFQAWSQSLSDIGFGTDSTLDVVTWNIEWFPKNESITPDSVATIINALDADIIGIQEIDDTTLFRNTINKLSNYELVIAPGYFGGLVYVYNTRTVNVQSIQTILNTEDHWNALPRSPLTMEFTFKGEEYVVINNHYKCCGDGSLNRGNSSDQEARRLEANRLIKKHIDENLNDSRVILLGDLNDILTDNTKDNVFQLFLADASNYLFVDEEIAKGPLENWSYPGWPSHLDHICISNELFAEFKEVGSSIETIKVEDYLSGGWSTYDRYISDHRPLGMKLKVNDKSVSVKNFEISEITLYPNPTKGLISIDLAKKYNGLNIQLFDCTGRLLQEENHSQLSPIQTSIPGPPGVYLIKIGPNRYFQKVIKN